MKKYKVNFVDIMDFISNLGIIIPLIIISIAFILCIFDKDVKFNFDVYSIIMYIIILAIVIVCIYAFFLMKDIDNNILNNNLKTIFVDENAITIITVDKKQHVIPKTDITKFQVNIDLSADWICGQYHTSYSLEIKINDNLRFTFNTITLSSIKKFLKIAKHIPNCTLTTSSNFIPYDIMQNILKTGKAVNPLLTFYYGLINASKNPPWTAVLSFLMFLAVLIYIIFTIFS